MIDAGGTILKLGDRFMRRRSSPAATPADPD
jgi:hypothetical protein